MFDFPHSTVRTPLGCTSPFAERFPESLFVQLDQQTLAEPLAILFGPLGKLSGD
jgi:hypothetical protein